MVATLHCPLCAGCLGHGTTTFTVDKIFQEVRTLPESVAREVLDFVGYLKAKHAEHPKVEAADMREFDQFGAVFDGKFNRDECYDRKVFC